ncbi:hypothetical protein GCM10009409_19880 [Shewanella saliphila]|uniref:Uncharacterized protein n=1 Tax=Shewanella saliphila TaxID=2282698 RepID=A0ABQ2Q7N1_9GAMM|nr:hypothetical protein GCM10009409_19880 [Shewanella saliphila]
MKTNDLLHYVISGKQQSERLPLITEDNKQHASNDLINVDEFVDTTKLLTLSVYALTGAYLRH